MTPDLPRGQGQNSRTTPLATAMWYSADALERDVLGTTPDSTHPDFSYAPGKLFLGRTTTGEIPVGYVDDRHIVTIAGSRSGKGVSAIIPNLCEYPGSILCIDPKGENAALTASRRGFGTSTMQGMHQDVYVLDPYGISDVESTYRATFDPLAHIRPESPTALEEATLLADALVVSTGKEDNPHFTDTARAFIEALILHVISAAQFEGNRTLGCVQRLMRDGDTNRLKDLKAYIQTRENLPPKKRESMARMTAFDVLLTDMESNEAFDGLIIGAASGLYSMGDRERGSVLSTARRNLKFLDAPQMKACLDTSDHMLELEELKRSETGASVYIVLPSRLMATHARWMRLILNLTVARLEADSTKPQTGHPVLAVLDEFAILRHLPIMETAIGYMAGFGLKIWAILQDISQLKRHYSDSWETFLGNAGMLQFFGNSDSATLEFISKYLGETEIIREVRNRSETQSTATADISDHDKLDRIVNSRITGKFFKGTALDNSTESLSVTKSSSQTQSESILKTALITPDEIRRIFSRESRLQIVSIPDFRPLYLNRVRYYEDQFFLDKFLISS